jgi:peptide/nickel transport system permease protein
MQVAEIPLPSAATPAGSSKWRSVSRILLRNRSAMLGLSILAILTFVAVFANVLATYDPVKPLIGIEKVSKRASPCIHLLGCPKDQPQHLFGTDGNVRDVFSRVLYGARRLCHRLHSCFIRRRRHGDRLVSSYLGGWVDNVVSFGRAARFRACCWPLL